MRPRLEADMVYPERFSNLPESTWSRLRSLLDAHDPGGEAIAMTIGEPRHPFPGFVREVLDAHIDGFGRYPPNEGAPELLAAITGWLQRRYSVHVTPNRVMALNGTREGLYNAAMALSPEQKNGQQPVVLVPNPFYQVYAVAALSVGAEPVFLPATSETGHLPDFTAVAPKILDRTAIAYICSPSNPQGTFATREYWRDLLLLAEKHDFIIFADECYAEIYRDVPPPGVLDVAAELGISPERVVSFHSLSKRSNVPGLRSGFVVSGVENIRRIRELRAYAGAPLPLPLQRVAEKLWSEETHVDENRALYIEKYQLADEVLGHVPGYLSPEAGMFLWLPVENGEAATVKLWKETGVRVLPGSYLSRSGPDGDPGEHYIRAALVAPKEEVRRGLIKLRDCLYA